METLFEKERSDHLIRPEALESELKKIKVNPEELRSDGTFDELLTEGRKTSRLVVARFSAADTEIEYKARLASQLQTDGTLQLSIHPVKMSLNEQLDKEFMNHYFSQKEKDNLKLFGHGGEVILLTVNGVETPCLVSADRLTNEVVAIEQKKVVIPDFYKNVELSQLNKESLSQGQPTFVKDVTTPEGFTLSGLIAYDADRQRLELLEYGLTLTQIHNVKLDKDQQQLLSEGKTILVPNIIDGKGEEYSAWIRLDMKSREIGLSKVLPEQKIEKEKKIKPSNDYRVQVNQNSHGIRTEENKFKIDPLKSGEVRDKTLQERQKRNDNNRMKL